MNIQNPYPNPPKKTLPSSAGMMITVGSQVGLAIIAIIFISLLLGLGLDALLKTEKHPFTILLFLGSVPFSLVVCYWLAKRTTKEINSQEPLVKQAGSVQEEGKRE